MGNPPAHKARKRFGQNFLQDQQIIDNIVQAVNPQADDHLVEIGPGQGAITDALVNSGARLDLIELDRDLVSLLQQRYGHLPNVTIHSVDALKMDFASLATEEQPLRIVGNLPYNISTPLIFHLLSFRQHILDMHFMLQLEVVNRMVSESGSKSWGRLGLMTQYWCQAESLFTVPPQAFDPVPKVESAIIRLIPHRQLPLVANEEKLLDQVVRTAFSQRRKTLRNNLKPLLREIPPERFNPDNKTPEAVRMELEVALGVDPGLRPEMLSLTQFITLSNRLGELLHPDLATSGATPNAQAPE